MDDTTLLIILIVFAVFVVILLCLIIYLYFVGNKFNKLAEQIEGKLKDREKDKFKKTEKISEISIYIDEVGLDSKKRYAPQFKIKSVSKDEKHLFYRTDDVKNRRPSEVEFRDHIKDVIETKLAIKE